MIRVFTWEMRDGTTVIDYLLAGRDMFTLVRHSGERLVNSTTYDDIAAAHRHVVVLTEQHENDGYVLRSGIWTCEVDVPISKIQTLIHQGNHAKAAQTLEPIIKAARIMGALHQ